MTGLFCFVIYLKYNDWLAYSSAVCRINVHRVLYIQQNTKYAMQYFTQISIPKVAVKSCRFVDFFKGIFNIIQSDHDYVYPSIF